MPKYEASKREKFISTVSLGFLAVTLLALAVYEPLIVICFACLLLAALLWGRFEQPEIDDYFQELKEERHGLSLCQFARDFDVRNTDTWIIRATYEEVQAILPTKHTVPILSSDNFIETLRLDEDDLDMDLVEIIARRTRRSLDGYESNPYYGKVQTVRDLVLFFNSQNRANAM